MGALSVRVPTGSWHSEFRIVLGEEITRDRAGTRGYGNSGANTTPSSSGTSG